MHSVAGHGVGGIRAEGAPSCNSSSYATTGPNPSRAVACHGGKDAHAASVLLLLLREAIHARLHAGGQVWRWASMQPCVRRCRHHHVGASSNCGYADMWVLLLLLLLLVVVILRGASSNRCCGTSGACSNCLHDSDAAISCFPQHGNQVGGPAATTTTRTSHRRRVVAAPVKARVWRGTLGSTAT